MHLFNKERFPYFTGHDTCECAGDPHCITLDGKKFDYQGTCEYRMFKTPSDSALDVEIKTKLGHRGRNKVK